MSLDAATLSGGFADPVHGAQAAFRVILRAMAEPGTVMTLPPTGPPPPLSSGAGAVALALLDADTPVWLDEDHASAARWLTFHTGAPVVGERRAARFALLSAPDLDGFALGDDDYPDRSATLVVAVRFGGSRFVLTGPGIDGRRAVGLSLPIDFVERWEANRALFPRGMDLLLVDGDAVMGLPRTTALAAA
ncbi:phosphonate C-P lyase system protein PhnH [Acuticoccus sp.]|uniref:phosphonate C-P lyase system protein PhnH n=1 Tax=Acuticoccus sp. TaxID=1904378 RepID=UPI003B51FD92